MRRLVEISVLLANKIGPTDKIEHVSSPIASNLPVHPMPGRRADGIADGTA
ncbi:hypothetical protein [Mesorhizobium sp. B2-8-5]|uniref:hypothetical protein n=1 Tax=Mesorhizobium sp. B2-8-5 TaxID=2589903 RepID=UPI0015E36FD7|nr:hypothetical protein [Mesorhizobium sp. B2-8-5]UCI25164.1 hypothetical protein FJ430_26900 [Mesorhizobium sp. B2-8-5]